jgi:hypothetical protein
MTVCACVSFPTAVPTTGARHPRKRVTPLIHIIVKRGGVGAVDGRQVIKVSTQVKNQISLLCSLPVVTVGQRWHRLEANGLLAPLIALVTVRERLHPVTPPPNGLHAPLIATRIHWLC